MQKKLSLLTKTSVSFPTKRWKKLSFSKKKYLTTKSGTQYAKAPWQ
jgi:hypothetical protein